MNNASPNLPDPSDSSDFEADSTRPLQTKSISGEISAAHPHRSKTLQETISDERSLDGEAFDAESPQPVLESVAEPQPPVERHSSNSRPRLGLRPKVMLAAIALATIPVIVAGAITWIWVNQRSQQLDSQVSSVEWEADQPWQLPLGFGLTTVLAGAIAAVAANRGTRPVVKAALRSNRMVNRLQRSQSALGERAAGRDELVALENNLSLLETQIPKLLGDHEGELEKSRVLLGISQRMREAHSEEEVFRIAVQEIRQAFRADRVAVYRLDSTTDGTIIEESVGSGWPKMLWTTLEDPCLVDYLDDYRQGRIRAIDDLYNSGLDDCHIGLLERFGIKANLVAPILKDKALFGLLIVNQCTNARKWQEEEIALLSQIIAQLGNALDVAQLMERSAGQVDQNQLLVDLLKKVRSSLNEEHVLQAAVTEWRKALRTDRVIAYGFDLHWYGSVIAESVVPGVPRALHADIYDPCFAEGYVDQYQQGRVQAVDDIYNAGLTDCHLKQLEPFQVKANLVAPILKDKKLFGLLIAHECSGPRHWQTWEIELHRQLAIQVGYALEQARLLKQVDAEMNQMQQLLSLSQAIGKSLQEEDVLKVTVEQLRRIFQADRVMVYSFDEEWYGTVVAESVVPGLPKALWAEIHDPCFAQGFVKKYQSGRVQAVSDIYKAGLTDCHLQQLEPFEVKANLVAPILKGDRLFGLLIAHQCDGPRYWQPEEITLIRQIALQTGLALDRARLMAQSEQAYQSAKSTSQSQRQDYQTLQQQVEQMLREGKETAATLQANALQQLDSVTQVYQTLKTGSGSADVIQTFMDQTQQHQQQLSSLLLGMTRQLAQVSTSLGAIHEMQRALTETTKNQEQMGQESSGRLDSVTDITTQLKLQAMNVALESARMGDEGKEFATIGETVLTLARQLDSELVGMKPLLNQLQSETRSLWGDVADNAQALAQGVQQTQQLQENCDRLAQECEALDTAIQSLAGNVTQQSEVMVQTHEEFVEMAGHVRQTSEQSLAIAKTIESWRSLINPSPGGS